MDRRYILVPFFSTLFGECNSALNLESDLAGTKHANRVTGKQRDLGLLGIWPGTHLGPRKECLAAHKYPLLVWEFWFRSYSEDGSVLFYSKTVIHHA